MDTSEHSTSEHYMYAVKISSVFRSTRSSMFLNCCSSMYEFRFMKHSYFHGRKGFVFKQCLLPVSVQKQEFWNIEKDCCCKSFRCVLNYRAMCLYLSVQFARPKFSTIFKQKEYRMGKQVKYFQHILRYDCPIEERWRFFGEAVNRYQINLKKLFSKSLCKWNYSTITFWTLVGVISKTPLW